MPSSVQPQVIPLPRRAATQRIGHELEFLAPAIEIIETPISPAGRTTIRIIIALVTTAVLWACLGKIDIIATAPGRIIPSGKVKTVQPLEIGVVKTIQVADGQQVHAGDVLVELDPTTNAADQQRIARDLLQSELDVVRLTGLALGIAESFTAPEGADPVLSEAARRQLVAELAQRKAKLEGLDHQITGKIAERDQAKANIGKLDGSMPFIEQRLQLYEKLQANQFVSKVAYLDAQQAWSDAKNNRSIASHQLEAAEAAIKTLSDSRLETESDFHRQTLDDLAKVRQKAAEFRQEQVKAVQRTDLQVLRAPVSGTVEQLSVHTVGGVVTPAQTLMVIVPEGSKLEVEAMLPNREVGFVRIGQETEVKVDAFTYTRYGLLAGRVEGVSRDALRSDKDQSAAPPRASETAESATSNGAANQATSSYVARISLKDTTVDTEQGRKTLEPGMAVTAEIKTGQRRVIEFLLSPLLRYSHEALKER
jgi:hemolysin D